MNQNILRLSELGRLPQEDSSTVEELKAWGLFLESLAAPVTDSEALALCKAFPVGENTRFGLAWSLVHLVETAPNWSLQLLDEAIIDEYWGNLLRDRMTT